MTTTEDLSIKEIVDKILKEGDIDGNQYPVESRIQDLNVWLRYYVEWAMQIGSKEPISGDEDLSETFTVVEGSNEFTRDIKDTPVFSVDFKYPGNSKWEHVKIDLTRMIDGFCWCGMKFFADDKRIWIENGQAGILRVTYQMGDVPSITIGDYNSVTPVYPIWMPKFARPLLYLKPAYIKAEYYKKDRAQALKAQVDMFERQFVNRYGRNTTGVVGKIVTKRNGCCGFGNRNYRR